MSNIKLKAIVGIVIAAVLYVALAKFNMLPGSIVPESLVPTKVDLIHEAPVDAPETGTVAEVALPGTAAAKVGGPLIRFEILAWTAQMGFIFANGGPTTTAGSLMEKNGVRLQLTRQNDFSLAQKSLIQFAEALKEQPGSEPTVGAHFVTIMGDGGAQFLAGVNKATEKLGPDYRAEIVGALGYSRGEDTFMGPGEWRDSPETMRGGVVAGVLRDGDWNIAQYYLAQNGIPNNPDETTYDPAALNWIATNDYLKAADMYVSGYCEDRQVVNGGKKTGETKKVCVQGVVTWTPGDVNIAKKKGGLVRILSTKENPYQMPAVVIGIRQWNMTHAKQVEGILTAAFAGADQVKQFPAALDRAARASYAVYAEESPAYWAKYFKGVTERDATGVPVPLGGSVVANFGDNLVLFGLAEGSDGESNSLYKATYEGFGNIAKQQYPQYVPDFPPVTEAVNTKFLKSLQAKLVATEPTVEKFEDSGPIASTNVVTKRNWSIQFATGKADFTPAAEATLNDLYTQLAVGAALAVEVQGHTDNVGNPDANRALSEARAFAVKQWLEAKSSTVFPENRISVKAFGDSSPIAPNTTPDGRAKNRRVTIILGTK